MFGSEALEVGIGVTLMLLFVSLICTAAREALEIRLRTRAADLEHGIRELLRDHEGTGLTSQLYAHPLIYSLFLGDYDPEKLKAGNAGAGKYMALDARANLPSYIPAANFAGAILDIVARGPVAQGPGKPEALAGAGQPLSIASLRTAAEKIDNPYLQRAMLSALDGANDDIGAAKANLELWFNGTMDRVSGWYKRRTQKILFVIGLVAAVTLNVDIITVAERLTQDKPLREAVVAQAKAIGAAREKVDAKDLEALQQKTFEQLTKQMGDIGYPIGWRRNAKSWIPWPSPQACPQAPKKPADAKTPADANAPPGAKTAADAKGQPAAKAPADTPPEIDPCSMSGGQWFFAIVGWVITAFAVMLGAPFWFDVLNKFMVIRSTVKPREKSQEEGSEDRPKTDSRLLLQLTRPGAAHTGNK